MYACMQVLLIRRSFSPEQFFGLSALNVHRKKMYENIMWIVIDYDRGYEFNLNVEMSLLFEVIIHLI
jgi:hypothetical protein